VAIKVLPAAVAADPKRLARFCAKSKCSRRGQETRTRLTHANDGMAGEDREKHWHYRAGGP
jgi:hypothetical protein